MVHLSLLKNHLIKKDYLNFVSRAVENYNLKKQNKEYESKLFSSYDLIGDSKNTINIIEQIKKISLSESRVFILRSLRFWKRINC